MSTSGDSQPYLNDFMMRDEEDGMTDDDSDNKQSGPNFMLREQDRFLPICNIIKIMKVPVPENGKIAKDARECIQECVSEFVSFITSEAIERSIAENRKTVNGDDLLYAFANLGFDNYVEPLSMYLQKFRESTKSDRNLCNEASLLQDDSSSDTPLGSSSAAHTYSAVRLYEVVDQHSLQQQQNGLNILPDASITITPATVQTSNAGTNTSSTFATLRRSARLSTRPPLPVVTTVANEMPGSVINAEQMLFFDADDLQQHVIQQQQQQQLTQPRIDNSYMQL